MSVYKTFRKGWRLLVCAIFLYMYPACRENSLVKPVRPVDTPLAVNPGAPKEAILLNRHYGNDPMQVMDIYLPKGRSVTRTNLMIFVHGGGWAGGDKSDFTTACQQLIRNNDFAPNYAFININYRLVKDKDTRFPAAELDVQAALDYIWEQADSFSVARKAALIGASAGGQLVTLVSYKHNEKRFIRSVISTWGPTDMKRFYAEGYAGVPEMLKWVTGFTPEENPAIYEESSPLLYVSRNSPPTFLAYGRQDSLVRLNQGISMDSALTKHGVPHIFFTFDGYHGYSSEKIANDAAGQMFSFIAKYMREE